MTQGMFSAVTGIRTNQIRMDVISDNIANLNTVAFKSSMVNFGTVFSRTISGGTAPVGTLGGTNPKQIGLGVTVADMGRDFAQGNVQTTGRTSDLNIQGEGFFVLQNGGSAVGPATGVLLTRAGNFTLDADGFMVNPVGLKVHGTDEISSNSIDPNEFVQIPRVLNLEKLPVGGPYVSVNIATPVGGGDPEDCTLTTYSIETDGSINATYSNGDRITVRTDAAGTGRELIYYTSQGDNFTGLAINVIGGALTAAQLQIRFASVTNNAGLVAAGGNLFVTGVNSGTAAFSIGNTGAVGLIDSGGLETSNVDLTREFSLLMLSQRALEANSRAFDAHNSVLQTIVNLAR